jgi:hypothetical protein
VETLWKPPQQKEQAERVSMKSISSDATKDTPFNKQKQNQRLEISQVLKKL